MDCFVPRHVVAAANVAQTFQPMLLAYRHRNHRQVAQSDFDLPQFGSGVRMLARTFGAPVVDAPDNEREFKRIDGLSVENWAK